MHPNQHPRLAEAIKETKTTSRIQTLLMKNPKISQQALAAEKKGVNRQAPIIVNREVRH